MIRRHRPFDVGLLTNRTAVYAVLAAALGAVYFTLVTAVNALLPGPASGFAGALAVGALFQPVRHRVDRMLTPRQNTRSVRACPDEALATAAEAVKEALRQRGAAVEVGERLVVNGELGLRPHPLPLLRHGEPVGRLLLAGPPRPGEDRLVGVLLCHVADVAQAVRLNGDLQRSRRRILTGREDERRRLRRDLHDGLAPTLAGLGMSLDTAAITLRKNPGAVAPLLADVRERLSTAIGDIRELVYGLRPPSLDEFGLVEAIRTLAEQREPRAGNPTGPARRQTGKPGARADVRAGDLGELPAAVEVAAYRIAQEALLNVRRHARAASALVTLDRDGDLVLRVTDDGVGMAPGAVAGAGLRSMRERAAELGGTCVVRPRPGGGTIVTATLPLEDTS
ncbi:sensor histidine kinase [Nonomuraea sp. NPDC046570]|uniref:sensor histidine kinase n=1 Tax=Nonomuraea sp. NPDC046570 TaxID=3155255 RepID=UPI0033D171EA